MFDFTPEDHERARRGIRNSVRKGSIVHQSDEIWTREIDECYAEAGLLSVAMQLLGEQTNGIKGDSRLLMMMLGMPRLVGLLKQFARLGLMTVCEKVADRYDMEHPEGE